MSAMPLIHEEIKKDLLNRIGRQWPPGARLPTVPQLARELGAGQRNTLRAMQELAREGYLMSRPKRGTYVASKLPNRAGENAVHAKTRIAIITTRTSAGFVIEMADALSEALAVHGVDPHRLYYDRPRELDSMPLAHFQGIAIINPDSRTVPLTPGQPAVIVRQTNVISASIPTGYDIVSVEEEQGGQMAGALLRQAGCRRVCFAGVHEYRGLESQLDAIGAARLRGFEAGWGSPLPPHQILLGRSYMPDSGSVLMSKYVAMNPRPDAIFAASDDLAIGIAIGGLALGLMPGRDYQLIGFDGQHRYRTMSECPPITSIAIPSAAMGRRAAELLMQRLTNPDKPVERVQLGCSTFPGETVHSPLAIQSEEHAP